MLRRLVETDARLQIVGEAADGEEAIRLALASRPDAVLLDLQMPNTDGLDAALAMVELARETARDVPGVQGDLEALPFRRGALDGAWARASYLHIARDRLPWALMELHHALAVGAPAHLTMMRGEGEGPFPNDDFAGRFFARTLPVARPPRLRRRIVWLPRSYTPNSGRPEPPRGASR